MRSALSTLSSNVLLAVVAGFLGFGSLAAAAAERYVEVWNPPEAQMHKSKAKPHGVQSAQVKKKRKSGPAVKQVADKTNIAPPALTTAPAIPGHAKTAPKGPDSTPRLPPLIGPDGRVLRV
ncbi:DUF1328 domain-containing protein [Caballeronia sordidicola]|uniref:DUF1328 domain-containing protein n=1 Tax=Caballeronia sordidicola TaxID=196367 RepID=UPI001F1EB774|nr:DUF1328 domain-containing protein [Caballeronia sordidicola]